MYEAYYGFGERPFALSPDPRFLYLSKTHREVLGHLVYGIREGRGFMAIFGEVGTGKTTLCRTILEREDDCDIAYLFNPTLTPTDLIKAINSEFGLSTFGDSRAELIDVLNTHLLERHADGFRVLVIIDEAQNLPDETLEQLRLLGNLESKTQTLLQILLIGQPELGRKLGARELRQLQQRISVWWRLGPLTLDETRGYIRHRLRVASGTDRPYFTSAALDEIHERTGGVPRLINVLADRSLLAGFGDQLDEIPAGLVKELADELRPRPTRRQVRRRALGMGVGGAAASAALVLASSLARPPEPTTQVAARPPALDIRDAPPPDAERGALPPVAVAPPPAEIPQEPSKEPLRANARGLDRLLGSVSPEVALRQSVSALLRAWGRDASVQAGVSRGDIDRLLTANGLVSFELMGLHALIASDTPAIIPLVPSKGSPRSALVREIVGSYVLLDGLAPDRLVEIPIDVLSARLAAPIWTVRSSTGSAQAPRLQVDSSAQSKLTPNLRMILSRE
jgi:general secretion pathway protein A